MFDNQPIYRLESCFVIRRWLIFKNIHICWQNWVRLDKKYRSL